jgi:hypothetical protein
VIYGWEPGEKLSGTGRAGARSLIDQPEPLPHSADEAAYNEIGQRPYEEIQILREGRENTEALCDSEAQLIERYAVWRQ